MRFSGYHEDCSVIQIKKHERDGFSQYFINPLELYRNYIVTGYVFDNIIAKGEINKRGN